MSNYVIGYTGYGLDLFGDLGVGLVGFPCLLLIGSDMPIGFKLCIGLIWRSRFPYLLLIG